MSKIFIDFGHWNNDSGAVGNGLKEVDINKSYGTALANELIRHGHEVLVGKGGSLTKRYQESNTWGAELFISCHTNAGGGDGFEVYCCAKGGKAEKCANEVYNQVVNVDKLNNGRGVKVANFTVITKTIAPAILIEVAFIDNADIECIDEELEQIAFGISIAKGVLKYLGTKIKPPTISNDTQYVTKKYKNGSTKEIVYSDSNCTLKVGSLDPFETCDCIYEWEGKAIVLYKVSGTNNEKVGFVKWTDGINK